MKKYDDDDFDELDELNYDPYESYERYDNDIDEYRNNNKQFYEDSLDDEDELSKVLGKNKKSNDNEDEEENKKDKNNSRFKAKVKPKYKVDDIVIYKKREAKVLFGPFERASKFLYEVQMLHDGTVVTASAQAMTTKM